MNDILNVTQETLFTEDITSFEYHSYQPYTSSRLNNNDEIRIPVNNHDVYTLPSESVLFLEGTIKTKDGKAVDASLSWSNNAFAFLFDELRFELNGTEIDKVRRVGLTSTLKGYVSFTPLSVRALENAGWVQPTIDGKIQPTPSGYFNISIPLSTLSGFFEDFKNIIINARLELVLIRGRNDVNCVWGNDNFVITLHKLVWKIPHVKVSDTQRLRLLNVVNKGINLSIPFRSWDFMEFPILPSSDKQTWTLKTSTQLEKPRFVLLAFQTARSDNSAKDASKFDHCNLTNVKLYLNSDVYPYDDLNVDFSKERYAVLYDMYVRFQSSYYGVNHTHPLLSKGDYNKIAPIVVLDCSRQSEVVKSATVDIRLDFESSVVFPANTTAICVIIHDRLVEYNPLSGVVKKH